MIPGLRRRLPRRAGAAATLAAALLVLLTGTPAGADPAITVTTPAEGATVDTATVAVSGRVLAQSALGSFKDVTLKVAGTSIKPPCPSSPCTFTWSPSLVTNGRYDLTVTATEQTLLLDGGTSTLTRTFVVDAPPAKPTLDPPRINDARTVDLTWSRNTEPDMLYYAVFRKDPAGTAYLPVGRVDQPASGKSVAFTDTTTTLNGGDYGYQVVAVRKGGVKAETASAPSASRTAAVPVPPTTTAPTVPGAPLPGQGSTTTVKPGAAAGVDLSGFLSSRATPTPAPPPTVLEPPDPGFKGTLPFGAAAPTDQVEEGSPEAVAPSTGRSPSVVSLDRARPLIPVAAGLVLLLLATHLRLLNRRLKPAARDLPIGDLPTEAADALPPGAPSPVVVVAEPGAAAPGPPAGPTATFYDVSDDEEWAAGQAAGEPEPEWEAEDLLWEPHASPPHAPQPHAQPQPQPQAQPEFDPEPFFAPVTQAGTEPEPGRQARPERGREPEFELEPVAPVLAEAESALSEAELDALEESFEVLEVISPARRPLVRSGRP